MRHNGILLVGLPETLPAAAAVFAGRRIVGAVSLTPCHTPIPGAAVLGGIADIGTISRVSPFAVAVICLPRAMHAAAERVVALLREVGAEVRTLPTADDVLHAPGPSGDVLDADNLIGRAPRALDAAARARAERLLAGKRVLITGAGGSIGSELARVVAGFGPSEVILMERAENALFEIDRRLAREFPVLPRRAMLHDVVEERATRDWLRRLSPQVVFHAAAHKHVTVMEDHPAHAVNNNFFGTRAIADAAVAAGAERFVMISTDKAVNPSSVMGATKRFAERYVAGLNTRAPATRCCMVRFGNVLASACSVIPIWSRQVAEGGPVTVTHPEMTRYFMTIPEAAQLVIQAGALDHLEAAGAGVFVLDMGQPVRIVELAERFIRATGFEPVFDHGQANATGRVGVKVVFTGPRPGEKLHEELAYTSEQLRPTPASGVLAWASADEESPETLARLTADLEAVRWSADPETVLHAISRHTPTLAAGARINKSSTAVRAHQNGGQSDLPVGFPKARADQGRGETLEASAETGAAPAAA